MFDKYVEEQARLAQERLDKLTAKEAKKIPLITPEEYRAARVRMEDLQYVYIKCYLTKEEKQELLDCSRTVEHYLIQLKHRKNEDV
jgi:hypothetical protein